MASLAASPEWIHHREVKAHFALHGSAATISQRSLPFPLPAASFCENQKTSCSFILINVLSGKMAWLIFAELK